MTGHRGAELRSAAEELDRSLVSVGDPLGARKIPGLGRAAIEEAIGSVGLTFPDEAVALWQWRDGTGELMLPGNLHFLGLEAAIDQSQQTTYSYRQEYFPWILPTWFVGFVSGQDEYWLHTEVGKEDPVPVSRRFVADSEPEEVVRAHTAPSITSMLLDMAMLIEDRYWRKNPRTGRFELHEGAPCVWL